MKTGDIVIVTAKNSPVWREGEEAVLLEPDEKGWLAERPQRFGSWWIHEDDFRPKNG